MQRRALFLASLTAAAIAPFYVACTAANNDTTGGEGGAGGGGSGQGNSGQGGEGGIVLAGSGVGGFAPGGACAADLQSITDGNGNVLTVCPPEQGCFEGQCIPACEAAAKSKGTLGCEYWAPDPPFYANGPGAGAFAGTCYAVFVANTWGRPAKITVARGGQMFDATQFGRIPKGIDPNTTYDPIPPTGLPPNEVAVLFLSHKPGAKHSLGSSLECPVQPAVLQDAGVQGSGKGSAFRVIVDTPITAYDILPYGGASSFLPSASLLLPSTSWGTNYYALAPHAPSGGALWTLVVGTEDGTMLKALPATTLPGGGALGAAQAGQTNEFSLNAGEMLQWIGGDPTGTVFQSDKPIGVWSGNTYLQVTSQTSPGGGGQDAAHQEIPPISSLGSEYVGAGVVTRLSSLASESIPYRVLGTVDGTTLAWDPAPPPGAPTTLEAGQAVEFETGTLFSVRSQDADHPFVMTHYLPGAPSNSREGCNDHPPINFGECKLGDEEWVLSLSPKQFLSRYAFFTDPTYATTNLVITRVKGPNGFEEVEIACLGKVSGWMPVGSAGQYEVAHVDLIRGSVPVTPQCGTSGHVASSSGQFGVTVWGTDWYASYGYPAGGNVGTLNKVVVQPVPK